MSSIALMSFECPPADFSKVSFPNKKRYCDLHSYDFLCFKEKLSSRPASWIKILYLQRFLKKYDWILWTDADSYVINGDRRIEEFIDPSKDLVVCEDDVGVNFGVFLIKNSDWSNWLLSEIWDFKKSAISKFLEKCSMRIRAYQPNCIISAAVKPNLESAHNSFGQEWDLWLDKGYIDWAVPMNYTRENKIFKENILSMKKEIDSKLIKNIIMGIGVYNQNYKSAGQKIIETPNIDSLAEKGILFTDHYSGSPVCAPSRSVLMTGQHSGHTYIRDNGEWNERGNVWSFQSMLDNPELEGQRPLPDSTLTVANVLQKRNSAHNTKIDLVK